MYQCSGSDSGSTGSTFFCLLDQDPDPLVRGMDPDPDPDPSIIMANSKKILNTTIL